MARPCTEYEPDLGCHCLTCGHPWWEHRRESGDAFIPEREWMADYYLHQMGPCPRCLMDVRLPWTHLPAQMCRSVYKPFVFDPSGWFPPPGLTCDRPQGHSGRHYSTEDERVIAVWHGSAMTSRLDWTRYVGTRS